MELSPDKKKKLAKVARIVEQGHLGVAEHLLELEDELEAKQQEIKDYVDKNLSKHSEELKALIPNLDKVAESIRGKDGAEGLQGVQGERGIEGQRGQEGREGRPGKDGRNGKDGRDGRNGLDGKDGLNGKDGTDGKEVNEEALLKRLEKKLPKGLGAHGIAGRDLFIDIDISSQFNGVLTTFNISAVWRIISVDLSSFPYGSLRKNIDYTWTPTSITFTNTIDASTQLATGQSCIITAVAG